MKKLIIVLLIIFLASSLSAFTQENISTMNLRAIGIGPEFNMDSRDNFAGGIVINYDYNVLENLTIGLGFSGSYNFSDFTSVESTLLLRNYFWGNCYGKFFFQADLGLFVYLEEDVWTPLPEIGLRGGFRRVLENCFYIEPYGRIGYPFAFGVGIVAGRLFTGD